MTHISRRTLSLKAQKNLIKTLQTVLLKINKKEDMAEFLPALLTTTEQLMLAKRLAVLMLLQEGYDQAQVARILNVTPGTVARLELSFEARGKGYEVAFRILKNEKMAEELKQLFIDLAAYSARAAGGRVKSTIL